VNAQSLLTVAGTLTSTTGAELIRAGTSITTAGDLLHVKQGGTVSLTGSLLTLRGTFAVGGSLVNVEGTLVQTGPSGLMETNGTTINAQSLLRVTGTVSTSGVLGTALSTITTSGDLIHVGATGSLTVGGQLVAAFGAPSFTVGGNFLTVAGVLTSTGAERLIQFGSGGAVQVTGDLIQVSGGGRLSVIAPLLFQDPGTLTLGGDVLAVAGTLLIGGAEPLLVVGTASARSLLTVTGTLTSTTTSELIAGMVTTTGDLLRVASGGTLSLTGPLLFGGSGTVPGNVLTVDGTLTRTSGGSGFQPALLTFGDATLSAQSLLTVTGALTSTAGADLISAGTSITTTGHVVDVKAGGTVSLIGGVLTARGAYTVGGSLVNIAGTLMQTGPSGLMETNGTTINAQSLLRVTGTVSTPGVLGTAGSTITTSGDLIQVGATGTLTVGGQLVAAFGALFTVGGNFLTVAGVLTGTGAARLIEIGSGGAQVTGDLIQVSGGGRVSVIARFLDQDGSLTVGGDVLAVAGTLMIAGADPLLVVRMASARSLLTVTGTLMSTTTAPLIFSGTVTTTGDLLRVASGASLSLAGRLLIGGGAYMVGGNVLTAEGTLTNSDTGQLISFDSSTVIASGAIIKASGRSTATTDELAENGVLMTVGSDQPVVHQGVLLETQATTMTAQKGIVLDNLLLQASAPLLNLRPGSDLTITGNTAHALDLSFRAKVTSLGPVVNLSASTLQVNNGAVVNVGGGSILRVTGNLLELNFGSTLRTLNGPLLNVAGGSVANISGALVSFGGSGNLVSVTNSLCPCTTFSGIPIALTGGATSSNVTIGPNPIANPGAGTLTTSSGNTAVAVVNGATSKLIITAP
jgi:hypothetical protein